MKQQYTLQPTLRFPEFEGNWLSKKIKDIAPLQRGFDLTSNELIMGKYPVVYSNGIQNYHNTFKVDGPGIVTGRSGTIGKIHYVEGKYWPHNTSLWVTDFKGNEPKFIYYFFLKLDFTKFNAGSTVPTLNRNDVHDLKRIIPYLPEQQKIADYLSTIDAKINLLEVKKEQFTLYKKAMMQKLFSQEIRFKDENGNDFTEWEEKRLGELAKKMQSGGTPKASNREYYENGGVPFLSISDITEQGKYLNNAKKSINQSGIDNSSSWIVPINSLIYSMYASVGFVTINKIEIATSQAVMNIILKNESSLEYIYYYLSYFRKYINRFIETGTQGNVNAEIVRSIKIPYPLIVEQQKIASFLSTIDESIEKVNEQITQTQSFKKAMLQQIFV